MAAVQELPAVDKGAGDKDKNSWDEILFHW